jgi:hypothetical protein
MSNLPEELDDAARKKKLIAEGAFFRVGIVHAKAQAGHAMRPQALLHDAVEHAFGFASARMGDFLAPGGLVPRLQSVMPYLLTAASFVGRRKLLKPVLLGGVVLAGGVAWLMRNKRTPSE